MRLGLIVPLCENIYEEFKKLKDLGFDCCQLNCWNMSLFTDDMAQKVIKAAENLNVEITALWCGWSGRAVWNFYEGPRTLGIVPEEYRDIRIDEIKNGSDFAQKIGVTDIITHVGFLPENPNTKEFEAVVCAIRDLACYCKKNGQYFLFETGQETPVTLLRTIEKVDTGNLGINLDGANLILYGKANPVDALDVFGSYVRNVHGKDGLYPTDGDNLGEETALGKGKVNYPKLISKLKEIGYDGPITIEREISGQQQIEDIKFAKAYLSKLI